MAETTGIHRFGQWKYLKIPRYTRPMSKATSLQQIWQHFNERIRRIDRESKQLLEEVEEEKRQKHMTEIYEKINPPKST